MKQARSFSVDADCGHKDHINCHDENGNHSYSIAGSVKVEYAFETARVRIYLPHFG